ncbi:hypothetical protein EV356DRAFT_521085 [Viridothelium virens]|uniref:MADS-box domain-containing protein n=1 Tax=Viridothelium virens TaxID=1048519 RepID=A0A6A6GUL1_VIRVR|nr:hypothetical protein EV356DRAFT_521085 [Viridothelium virens]
MTPAEQVSKSFRKRTRTLASKSQQLQEVTGAEVFIITKFEGIHYYFSMGNDEGWPPWAELADLHRNGRLIRLSTEVLVPPMNLCSSWMADPTIDHPQESSRPQDRQSDGDIPHTVFDEEEQQLAFAAPSSHTDLCSSWMGGPYIEQLQNHRRGKIQDDIKYTPPKSHEQEVPLFERIQDLPDSLKTTILPPDMEISPIGERALSHPALQIRGDGVSGKNPTKGS